MSTTKNMTSFWLRPEPNDRRPRFNREQITAAVLKIADSEGFEALTMKRIADELDCGIMTLLLLRAHARPTSSYTDARRNPRGDTSSRNYPKAGAKR